MSTIASQYGEILEKIIGCAYRVYNKMGFGFLESVYEKCLLLELNKSGLRAESQQPITVRYDGEVVGEFVADIIVESGTSPHSAIMFQPNPDRMRLKKVLVGRSDE